MEFRKLIVLRNLFVCPHTWHLHAAHATMWPLFGAGSPKHFIGGFHHMSNVKEVIQGALADIQEQQGYRSVAIQNDHRVVKDLGFSSLDVAQLIAVLEMELEVDPFAQGVSIMEVHTVGELIRVYEDAKKAS